VTSQGGGRCARVRDWLETRFNLAEIFSVLTAFGLFPAEIDTRKPLREAVREALDRGIPSYARWPRVLGILSVLLFFFLILTGVMLAFYYQPTVSEAHASVTTLVSDVHFGWFVHQIHLWGARLFLLILLLRLARFFFQGLYKKPREAFWVVAMLTFLAATHADFTGTLLPWDTRGYWTAIRGLEILYALPVLGPLFSFLVGGPQLDSLVLIRFYFLHVAVLPAILLALFYLHFSGVRRVGLSATSGEVARGPGLLRRHAIDVTIVTVLIFGGLITLATLIPASFSQPADPFVTPRGAAPPWYLLASHGFLETFPAIVPRWVRGLLLEGILAFCILLPFLDRSPGQTARERRLAIAAGAVVLALWLVFTWHGYRLEVLR
jgi:quinol-cytochrome oxidoreductase complex cytochrome b subunit